MQSNPVRDKARKFHDQIRKEQLNQIFRQKRSKLREFYEQTQNQRLFHQRLNQQLLSENEEQIDFEFSFEEMHLIWTEIKNFENNKQVNNQHQANKIFSNTQQYQEPISSANKQQVRRMNKICHMISHIIRQINEYNEYQPSRLQQIISSGNECQKSNVVKSIVQNVELLLEITQFAKEKLYNFSFNSSLLKANNIVENSKAIYHELIIWINIIVQVTSFKYPSMKQNQLIRRYKEQEVYKSICEFSENMLQQSVMRIFPQSLALIMNLMRVMEQLTRIRGQVKGKQMMQSMNIVIQMIISMYYIVGNVMSDFQPIKISKVTKYHQSIINKKEENKKNNIIEESYGLQQVEFYVSLVDKLDQYMLNVPSFYQIFTQLQICTNTIYEECVNFNNNNNTMQITYNTQYQQQQQLIKIKTQTYRHYISLVQLQIWLSRLLLIGGWIDSQNNGDKMIDNNSNKYQNTNKNNQIREKLSVTQLLKYQSIREVHSIIQLVDRLNITSKQSIQKIIKQVSQCLLIIQLSIRQQQKLIKPKLSLNKKEHSRDQHQRYQHKINYYQQKTLGQQRMNVNNNGLVYKQNRQVNEYKQKRQVYEYKQKRQVYELITDIKKLVTLIVQLKIIQSQNQLILVNQINTMLIDAIQVSLYQPNNNQCVIIKVKELLLHQQLIEFIIQCSQAKILSSSILTLPLLIIENSNQYFIQSLNNPSHLNLIHSIYSNLTNSISQFVPIHINKNIRMIQQEDDFTHGKKFNSQFLKKMYLSNPASIFNYFVQNLSHRKQQEFYVSYLRMLKECHVFYQQFKTSHLQFNLIRRQMRNQEPFRQRFISFLSEDFFNKFLYFVVDRLSQFEETSPVHLQVLRFILMILNTTTNDQQQEWIEEYLKNIMVNNGHGIREHLQNMTLWESEQVNESVIEIFQHLQIE